MLTYWPRSPRDTHLEAATSNRSQKRPIAVINMARLNTPKHSMEVADKKPIISVMSRPGIRDLDTRNAPKESLLMEVVMNRPTSASTSKVEMSRPSVGMVSGNP